jgi:putative transposase
MIHQQTDTYDTSVLCQTLGVSRSGYYAWRKRSPSGDELTPKVTKVFWQHSRRYGSRRITAELQAQGEAIGRRRVRRILQQEQLHAIQPKSFVPRTTNSRHGRRMSPNLLEELIVSQPRQVLVSDITYLPLQSGQWAYLATWLDLYSRKVVGWQIAETMTAELIIGGLQKLLLQQAPEQGLIVHSDRGGQYVDAEFRRLLQAYGYRQSMSRAGETYDNAFAESLFSRYKAELLEGGAFRDVTEAQIETFEYIERYYNPVRRHSALGYVSPEQFEQAYYQGAKNASLTAKNQEERNAS